MSLGNQTSSLPRRSLVKGSIVRTHHRPIQNASFRASTSIVISYLPVLMCTAGQSMNRWSLEEMVKRDPDNSLILLQQIIRKTRQVRVATSQGSHAAHRAPLTHLQLSVFRFWRSVSTSWWLPSLSCSPLRCFRYTCCSSSWSVCSIQLLLAHPARPL